MRSFVANPFERKEYCWSWGLQKGGKKVLFRFRFFSPFPASSQKMIQISCRKRNSLSKGASALLFGKRKALGIVDYFRFRSRFRFVFAKKPNGMMSTLCCGYRSLCRTCGEKASFSPTLPAPCLKGKSAQHERDFKLQGSCWDPPRSGRNLLRFSEGS